MDKKLEGESIKESKWIFKKAYGTNTRLMGVVGLRVHWNYGEREIVEYFHLDYEEFGFDGFERLIDPDYDEIENKTLSVMGGLGGGLVELPLEICEKLIVESININNNYDEEMPIDLEEIYYYNLNHTIDMNEYVQVMKKVSSEISSEIELINYYFMRVVGIDKKGFKLLSDDNFIELKGHNYPSTLLRNEIIKEDDYYYVKSLIDDGNRYRLFTSNISIETMKVSGMKIIDDIVISAFEASLMLKKAEYIAVFDVSDCLFSEEIIDKEKISAMKNYHGNGILYTEFKKDNDHVKNDVYYLNDDIFCIYFLTDSGQLLLVSFSQENYEEGKKWVLKNSYLEGELESEFRLDSSLFYDFVNSECDNFYDFV